MVFMTFAMTIPNTWAMAIHGQPSNSFLAPCIYGWRARHKTIPQHFWTPLVATISQKERQEELSRSCRKSKTSTAYTGQLQPNAQPSCFHTPIQAPPCNNNNNNNNHNNHNNNNNNNNNNNPASKGPFEGS